MNLTRHYFNFFLAFSLFELLPFFLSFLKSFLFCPFEDENDFRLEMKKNMPKNEAFMFNFLFVLSFFPPLSSALPLSKNGSLPFLYYFSK